MKMTDLMQEKKTLSFELIPPQAEESLESYLKILDQLAIYEPDFISSTYGVGGSAVGQNKEILQAIQQRTQAYPMTHYTSIEKTKADVKREIKAYIDLGIETILAVRGDYPTGWTGTRGDFQYANELVKFIHDQYPELEIAVGGYPEKHKEAQSLTEDIQYLKGKQEAGANLIITQICYDTEQFARWLEQIRAAGVTIPVNVGIMPVMSKEFIIRNTLSNACSIPRELAEIIANYGEQPEEFKKAGKEYTAHLIQDYLQLDVNGLQIFTLNQAQDIGDILDATDLIK